KQAQESQCSYSQQPFSTYASTLDTAHRSAELSRISPTEHAGEDGSQNNVSSLFSAANPPPISPAELLACNLQTAHVHCLPEWESFCVCVYELVWARMCAQRVKEKAGATDQ
ncbi:hypothetical protein KUCAC02_012522, partial [Chaenocephalus aceratus]